MEIKLRPKEKKEALPQKETPRKIEIPFKPAAQKETESFKPIPQADLKAQPVITAKKDKITEKIEAVMTEGLGEIYQSLTPAKKIEFKIKGEETAKKIRILIYKARLSLKKLFKLLLQWLKILPGVNKYFIEQEAKIKAEKIIEMHNEVKKQI